MFSECKLYFETISTSFFQFLFRHRFHRFTFSSVKRKKTYVVLSRIAKASQLWTFDRESKIHKFYARLSTIFPVRKIYRTIQNAEQTENNKSYSERDVHFISSIVEYTSWFVCVCDFDGSSCCFPILFSYVQSF